jgi:hypothetical protein
MAGGLSPIRKECSQASRDRLAHPGALLESVRAPCTRPCRRPLRRHPAPPGSLRRQTARRGRSPSARAGRWPAPGRCWASDRGERCLLREGTPAARRVAEESSAPLAEPRLPPGGFTLRVARWSPTIGGSTTGSFEERFRTPARGAWVSGSSLPPNPSSIQAAKVGASVDALGGRVVERRQRQGPQA